MAGRERDARHRIAGAIVLAWMALSASPVVAQSGDSTGGPTYEIVKGQVHKGDLTLFKSSAEIAGTVEGNVRSFGQTLSVPGEVTGNVIAYCATVTVAGRIGKDFTGRCGTVVLEPSAVIGGDAEALAGQISIGGIIEGDVEAAGGEIACPANSPCRNTANATWCRPRIPRSGSRRCWFAPDHGNTRTNQSAR